MPTIQSVTHRLRAKNLAESVSLLADSDRLLAHWASGGEVAKNWGDLLNPTLIYFLTGSEPANYNNVVNVAKRPVHYVVGSGLGNFHHDDAIIWGMGFRTSDAFPRAEPRSICAVRGPLSRQKYIEAGIECPRVYGDPALLLPRFYHPSVEKKYDLGIVPHIHDQSLPVLSGYADAKGVRMLDIKSGIFTFARELLACRTVASSSLHGLIAADSYGIPSTWINLREHPDSHYFKHRDYLKSVGRPEETPLSVVEKVPAPAIQEKAWRGGTDIDLEKLLEACPFRTPLGSDPTLDVQSLDTQK